jgi:cytochrome c biogenesis protein CcmG/thiol:disulfide interchange protein DsbE
MLNSRLTKFSALRRISKHVWPVALGVALFATVCAAAENPKDSAVKSDSQASENKDDQTPADEPDGAAPQPCITGPSPDGPSIDTDNIPRFAVNSPFGKDSSSPAIKRERMLWADSWLWTDAPEFVVEKWLTDEPDMKGKYVLIEFWATWCPPCRRSLTLLNGFHEKYGDELVVIGVCEEDEENTRKLNEKYPDVPKIEFYSAIDTQKRMKDTLRVWGIPHIIIVEPDKGGVIWEGFPAQRGYELTDKIVERFLAVGRKLRAKRESAAAE